MANVAVIHGIELTLAHGQNISQRKRLNVQNIQYIQYKVANELIRK